MAFERNPFDILGLSTSASSRDIRRRLDDLTMQVNLELAPDGIDEPLIRSIRQALEDPIERFKAELTWLLWNDDTPQLPAMSKDADLQDHSERLAQDQRTATPTDLLLISHDLAVLDLVRFARNPTQYMALTQALNNWQQTLQSTDFWRLMEKRAEARADVRLNARALQNIREALPEHLLRRALADVGPARGDSFMWDVEFEAPVFLPSRVALEIGTEQGVAGEWKQSGFVAWSPRSGRRHFSGTVSAL